MSALAHKYLSAQQTKGADGFTVYINEKLRKQIKKYITAYPTLITNRNRKLIFSAKGIGFSAQTIVNLFQRLYKLSAIEGASSHSGRRQFVSSIADKGINARIVQQLARHFFVALLTRTSAITLSLPSTATSNLISLHSISRASPTRSPLFAKNSTK